MAFSHNLFLYSKFIKNFLKIFNFIYSYSIDIYYSGFENFYIGEGHHRA